MARPTVMTKKVMEFVCQQIAGGESLSKICRDESMPARSTILLAVVNDRDGFRTDYMRAREAAGFSHADTIIELVESVGRGDYEPNVAKVMIDGLKWAAERMAANYHGTKQSVDHTSSDGSMTQKPAVELTDEQLLKIASGNAK
jgi:hypothetical protein